VHFRNDENANDGMVDWGVRDKIPCLLNKTRPSEEMTISPTSAMRQLA